MAHCYDCAHSARVASGKAPVIWCFFIDRATTAAGVCQAWQSRDRAGGFNSGSVCNTRSLSNGLDSVGVDQW